MNIIVTVKSVIKDLIIQNIHHQQKLAAELGASRGLLKHFKKIIDDVKRDSFIILGLNEEYREQSDEEVIKLEESNAEIFNPAAGWVKSVVLRITTNSGVWYYDYLNNKFGKSEEMGYSTQLGWREVDLYRFDRTK